VTGLAAVIARVDAIETQIVSLDPAGRAAATAAAEATAETSAASSTTFAGVLEAAKAASTTESSSTTPETAEPTAAAGTEASGGENAQVLAALQTLFSANASGAGGSTPSVQKIMEMLG
jgi:hypothetical protein